MVKTKACKWCGREFKGNGVLFHEPSCKANTRQNQEASSKMERQDERQNLPSEREHENHDKAKMDENLPSGKGEKFQEVNMKGNYDEKKAEIEPSKKEESERQEFQCGACGATFGKRHNFCPSCGVGFE